MAMSRKDYSLIAEVLRVNFQHNKDYYALIEDMALNLASTNPRFDRDRFMAASWPAVRPS